MKSRVRSPPALPPPFPPLPHDTLGRRAPAPARVPRTHTIMEDFAVTATHRAHRARSPRYADRRSRPAGPRSTSHTVRAARSRLARSQPSGLRRAAPWLKTQVLRGEWRHSVQEAAIRRGGMAVATAWRCGTYGRPVPFPKLDRSTLPRAERTGRPRH